MASSLKPKGLRIPPRARIRPSLSSRREHVQPTREREFSITGRYLQILDQESYRRDSDCWASRWQVRKAEFTENRPARLRNIWMELAFIHSICMPGLLVEYFLVGFVIILPRFMQTKLVSNTENQNGVNHLIDQVWAFVGFPLTICISLLILHRCTEKFGQYICHVSGLIWLAIWLLASGFANSFWFLCFCRAASGIGAAAVLAPATSFIEAIYPPGRRRSTVLLLYNLSEVSGIMWSLGVAAAVSSTSAERCSWYFWIGALHSLFAAITSMISLPSDFKDKVSRNQHLAFDVIGMVFLVTGLFFVLFAIIQAPSSTKGWATAYIPCLLIIGLAILGNFVHVERCGYATFDPLLPIFILKRPGVRYLLFLGFVVTGGQTGLFYLWSSQLFQSVWNVSSAAAATWFVPFCIASLAGILLLPKLLSSDTSAVTKPSKVLTQVIALVAVIILAMSSSTQSYWRCAFSSMVLMGFALSATGSIISTSITKPLPEEEKHQAHTLVKLAKYLGMTLIVGIGGNIQASVLHGNASNEERSIKAVFWFNTGCAGLVVLLVLHSVQRSSSRQDPEPALEITGRSRCISMTSESKYSTRLSMY